MWIAVFYCSSEFRLIQFYEYLMMMILCVISYLHYLLFLINSQVEKKGKTGTRGSKQILEENVATKKFYQKMSIFSCAFFIIAAFLITTLNGTLITMSIIAFLIHGGANYFMDMMSRPTYVDDPGTDLNMEGGVAE